MDGNQRCRLCLQPGKLCNSHIIPEFLFVPLYDHNHRFYGLPGREGERIELFQKGAREKLLCKKCEADFSVYENHARRVLYGGTEISIEDHGSGLHVGGIDYHKFKLFLMSLLWRLAVTTFPYLKGIDLRSDDSERLRTMLLAKDAGEPWQYGCMISGLLHEGRPLKDLITSPARGEQIGLRFYGIAIGGFVFTFFVSDQKVDLLVPGFLRQDGGLMVLRRELRDIHFLMQSASKVAEVTRGKPLP